MHLTLSHFRSYRRAEIETGGRTILLYGANGTGKTNLLEAVSLLSPGRGLRGAGAEALARQPEAIGWRLQAGLALTGGRHEIELRAEAAGPRAQRIDGKPAPQIALGRLLRILWLTPAMDRLWNGGAAERRRFLDRIAMSFDPSHADAAILYEKTMRERNRLLKEDVRDAGWYAALEAQMARAGAEIAANRVRAIARLMEAQAQAVSAFPRANLTLADPEDAPNPGAAALAEALARGRMRDRAAGRSLTGPHRSDLVALYAEKGQRAQLCSTGEQKALLVSLVMANARALYAQNGAPPVLLLDEAAAHLDAARRAALYAELAELGAQSWMTATDPGLFDRFPGPALHLRVTEADGSQLVLEQRD
ncbi:MAG: DNA replication/repair protein RecF [Pseudomonadota bacterium]